MVEPSASVPAPPVGSWQRARERLARRPFFRLALALLVVLAGLALYAPLLANDRPVMLVARHKGDHERARKSLVPVTRALAGLLARSEAEYLAARAAGSTQSYSDALAAERAALATRLATLERGLEPEFAASLAEPLAAADEGIALARRGANAEAVAAGAALVLEATQLVAELDPARVTLVARRSFPLFAALTPLEVGLEVAWLWVLAWPFWRRRLAPARGAAAAALSGLVAALWFALAVGGGSAFHASSYKDELARGELEAERVVFAPIPYAFAEQHPEESMRPPTWLAAAELDERGAYVRGARVPVRDEFTGFVPETRPVEVRPGEPARNAASRHWLGTDGTGRDLAARLVHGARASLLVACLATLVLLTIGVLVGALAGTLGGWVDLVLSRVIEVIVAFPLLFLVLVAVAFVGPSVWNVVLVLGCVGWTSVARLARSEFLRQRELEYVLAARAMGFSTARIALCHMLPNTLAPLLVAGTFSVGSAILIESALSFLGYGVRVPIPSWGALTSESRDLAYWWLQVFPGFVLFLCVLCVQVVGDALRDALDPRQEERA